MVSCTSNKKPESDRVYHAEKVSTYRLDSTFYVPRMIHSIDSFLVIGDLKAEKLYSVFRLGDMNKIFSFGAKGTGPNEYIFSDGLRRTQSGFYVFDRALLKINELTFSPNQLPTYSYVRITPSFAGLYNLIQTADSSYVALSFSEDYRYVVVKNDSVYPSSIDYPDDGINCSRVSKSLVYQGNLQKHPRYDKFVFVSYYGQIMEILQLTESGTLEMVSSFNKIYPQYVPSESVGFNFMDKNMTGCLSLSVTENYIYQLYSGKEKTDSGRNFSDKVLVYDWEGNLVRTLLFEEELSGFCVNDDDTAIYGLAYDEDAAEDACFLFVYDIVE